MDALQHVQLILGIYELEEQLLVKILVYYVQLGTLQIQQKMLVYYDQQVLFLILLRTLALLCEEMA